MHRSSSENYDHVSEPGPIMAEVGQRASITRELDVSTDDDLHMTTEGPLPAEEEYDLGEPQRIYSRTLPSHKPKPSLSVEVSNLQSVDLGHDYKLQSIRSPVTQETPAIPRSSYYVGPPGIHSVFGTQPTGQIGVHHPREIVRIERDYTAGELPQFFPIFPLELEGRITPTQFQETINDINEILISAHSIRASFFENTLAAFTLYTSMLFVETRYEREMKRLATLIDDKNAILYHPQGLHILWPRKTAFLFLEIEYY